MKNEVVVVMIASILLLTGCSNFFTVRAELKATRQALSELEAEHGELKALYESLQSENQRLQSIVANRGNIRDLYTR